MSKVWLVTGSASGLGGEIAEAVLASGDRLPATARDPQRLNDLVERYGEQVYTAPLDVAYEAAAKAAVAKAVDALGGLDVLVNNAGYGDIGPFEQVSSERFRALFETNFFGVVSMTRAAIGACVSNAQQKNSNQPRDCCSKLLIIRRGEVAEWLKAAVC